MRPKYWLLLEKSDETRVSKGIDAYRDETGRAYHYDSLVPNHKNLCVSDIVVIRKEKQILGTGVIDSISKTDEIKIHRRFPVCKSTDIRERARLTPLWKCGKCSEEFAAPITTETQVSAFVALIQGFNELTNPPTVQQVKACAVGGNGEKSQLSMIELDPDQLATTLGGSLPTTLAKQPTANGGGQGFGLSVEQRRAVELHAMSFVENMYIADGWSVENTANTQPYDFMATRGNQRRFIEVKGTTGSGECIVLTRGEADHANEHSNEMALIVISGIILSESEEIWRADGGRVSAHLHPWSPEPERLYATEYRYSVPRPSN